VEFDSQQTPAGLLNSHTLSMSDLHRSAISARLAKLPPFLPTVQDEDDDDEMINTIGDLPGSGIGPPAMQVMIFIGGVAPVFIQN
jgi:hypothetical protein